MTQDLQDRLGRPLRDLRLSVTDRCNLRCPYCMPAEVYGARYRFLRRDEILSFEEIERLARLFVRLGVEKIRITGGEPLLRQDLPRLVERLAALDGVVDLTLTTNGVLLPRFARDLREAGLHRVTVSLDALDDATLARTSGVGVEVAQVLGGIEAAEAAGLFPLKINCVVRRGVNEHAVVELAEHFKGRDVVLRFIEYMDVGTLNDWSPEQVLSAAEILERLRTVGELRALEPNYPGEVARRYAWEDGAGEIGLIASVSQPFCRGCTRARLSTEGVLYTCLFAQEGVDLMEPLRAGADDETLRERIAGVWRTREDRYSEERGPDPGGRKPRIEMYRMGG